MSESFQLLVDHDATAEDAPAIASRIVDAMVAEQIILPETDAHCVLTGNGFPPGPRLRDAYKFREHELHYWDDLQTVGVKVHTDRYVNFFGFPIFEHISCPGCHRRFADDTAVMDQLYECVGAFINDDRLDEIECPSCSRSKCCTRWTAVPDLGFCCLAIEFWNWPTFDAPGWTLSIPRLLTQRTGRELAHSWGHM